MGWITCVLEKDKTPKLSNSLSPTFENHAPYMRVQRTMENTKHSEGNRMQTPGSTSFSNNRPVHISLADPVKEWLGHPPLPSFRFLLRVRGLHPPVINASLGLDEHPLVLVGGWAETNRAALSVGVCTKVFNRGAARRDN